MPCGGVDAAAEIDSGETIADAAAAPDAGRTDCPPLTGVTEAACAAAYEDPTSAADEVLYACAGACRLGVCYVWDATACTTCACDAYVRSDEVCGPAGDCGEPLNGTGCLGLGFYGAMPWRCPTDTLVSEGACMLRHLFVSAACDGTP